MKSGLVTYIAFSLAASTGPSWTVSDILALADDDVRHRFLHHKLVYGRPAGADSLREAIAEMQGVPAESVQIVTGASEALVALMWMAADPARTSLCPFRGSRLSRRCRNLSAWKLASIMCVAKTPR
jgi:hypothetical protein